MPSLYPDAAEKLKKSSQWTLPAVWCRVHIYIYIERERERERDNKENVFPKVRHLRDARTVPPPVPRAERAPGVVRELPEDSARAELGPRARQPPGRVLRVLAEKRQVPK